VVISHITPPIGALQIDGFAVAGARVSEATGGGNGDVIPSNFPGKLGLGRAHGGGGVPVKALIAGGNTGNRQVGRGNRGGKAGRLGQGVVARIRAGKGVAGDRHHLIGAYVFVGEGAYAGAAEGNAVPTDKPRIGDSGGVQGGGGGTVINLIAGGNATEGQGLGGDRVGAAGSAQGIVIAGQTAISTGAQG